MKTFTAKQLHESPAEVYRTANNGDGSGVILTHKHHGKFLLLNMDNVKSISVTMNGSVHPQFLVTEMKETSECITASRPD